MAKVVTKQVGKILHKYTTYDDEFACVLVSRTGISTDHLPSFLCALPMVGWMEIDSVEDDIQYRTDKPLHIGKQFGERVALDNMTSCSLYDTFVDKFCRIVEDVTYERGVESILRIDIGTEARDVSQKELQRARHIRINNRRA